jgi:probable HAF family extracellular repeat protein
MLKQKQPRRSRFSARTLTLEVLEDRCLLSYTVTDLGTLGGRSAEAYGLNGAGQVVGWADTTLPPLHQHAFLWDGGGMTDLDPNGGGGRASQAFGINDAGQVVGFAFTPWHAVLWQNGQMIDLGTLGGQHSAAFGINATGQVVGGAYTPTSVHAFLWQQGVGMTDLGALPGGASSASAINNGGQVVGVSLVSSYQSHAFFWQQDVGMIDLGTLPGDVDSQANGINNLGHVVGWSGDENLADFKAFFYNGSAMTDLGLPLGGIASGINDADQVVGRMVLGSGGFGHAYLYAGGVVTDLNSLISPDSGLILDWATAINNAGQIVGIAHRAGGPSDGTEQHAFLLTPDGGGGAGSSASGVFAVLASVREAANIGSLTNQPPASALREPAPVETAAPLPASAALRQATDALFASNHRPQPEATRPSDGGEWALEQPWEGGIIFFMIVIFSLPVEGPGTEQAL